MEGGGEDRHDYMKYAVAECICYLCSKTMQHIIDQIELYCTVPNESF